MPATPGVTLTATLQDLFGGEVGTTPNPSKLSIALCGYGPQLPRIAGTSLLARVGPIYLESSTGIVSTQLWGNDVITPPGTYYTIAVIDGQGNVVQSAAYKFTGSGAYDLSSFAPMTFPGQGVLSPQGMQLWNHNVTLAEGGGTVYTLPYTPYPGMPFLLFRSGLLQQVGSPPFGTYMITGNTITFTDSGTEVGDTLDAIYWHFS